MGVFYMLTQHQRGFLRDKLVLDTITQYKALDTEQIYRIFFSNLPNGKRIAQRRLARYIQLKILSRAKPAYSLSYYYYKGRRPSQPDHLLSLNWVLIWLGKYDKILNLTYEVDCGNLRCDAFVSTKSNNYFIEMDMAGSLNPFVKVKLYNDMYSSDSYLSQYWVKQATKFPEIIVVTTTKEKMETIRKHILDDNCNNLCFKVYLLDTLKKEVLR